MLSWNVLAQLMHFRKSSAPKMAIFFLQKNVRIFFFSFAGQEEWWFAAAADNCLVKLGSWGRKTEERKKRSYHLKNRPFSPKSLYVSDLFLWKIIWNLEVVFPFRANINQLLSKPWSRQWKLKKTRLFEGTWDCMYISNYNTTFMYSSFSFKLYF